MSDLFYLRLKTQKVQSFIFKIPKLKAMLGANSLLGEFFAVDLPDIRKNIKAIPHEWNEFIKNKKFPEWKNDNLNSNFSNGIICSAGGHFETLFSNQKDAMDFIEKVQKKVRNKISGINVSYFLKKYKNFDPKMKYSDFVMSGEKVVLNIKSSEPLIDNPYFYLSDEDGEHPQISDSKYDNDSFITKLVKEQGENFYNGKSEDFLTHFIKEYAYKNDKWNMKDFFPNDLEDYKRFSLIPQNNKIAVIAIDGNAMGDRFFNLRNEITDKSVFKAIIEMEKFWFNQRNKFRTALKNAIDELDLKEYFKNNSTVYPFQILMLGGDDLLIISVPELAFDLVNNFAYHLNENNDNKTTISAGIAFVNYSFPFSQAHELAESLLSSAKVKSRIWKNNKTEYVNAVDWHIHFTSGTQDINEIRKKNYYLEYNDKKEILTQRPCTINEMNKIWNNARELFNKFQKNDDYSGRNKYKRLRTLLKSGENNVKLYGKLLEIDETYLKYDDLIFLENTHIKINTALDVIELIDFFKRDKDNQKEGVKNESN